MFARPQAQRLAAALAASVSLHLSSAAAATAAAQATSAPGRVVEKPLPASKPARRANDPIPTPASIIGFEPGADRKLPTWKQVTDYFTALDKASPRVSVRTLGKTTLGRPFLVAFIADPATLANLERYRQIQRKLLDPRLRSPGERERLIVDGKLIVLITSSIHSTEVGGILTPMVLADRLARAETPEARQILASSIIMLVPSQNPDGVDIVGDHYRATLGKPNEGSGPPDLYHYYAGHDNNRDWYAFTLPETRYTVDSLYTPWDPQINNDIHQQGANAGRIFIPPYMDPVEPNIDPILTAGTNSLGSAMSWRMISDGFTGVATNASYDQWSPARQYALNHHGVRILTETASARLASPMDMPFDKLGPGRGYDAREVTWNYPVLWPGGTWTIGDIVKYQTAASWALLVEASRDRQGWLESYADMGDRALGTLPAWGKDPWPSAFVIPKAQTDTQALQRLVWTLQHGQVEIREATAPVSAGSKTYPAGSYVALVRQPFGTYAKALLERQQYPDLHEYPGGPPKRPYDVTAHTLPLLFGVDVDAAKAPFEADLAPLGEPPLPRGRVEARGARLALGHATGELVALARLLAAGVPVRWTLDPVEENGRRFPPGTLVVPASARRKLEPIAAELGIVARGLRAEPRSLTLRTPRVGLYRSWVPSMDEGWTRYVFEKEMAVPYRSLVDAEVRAGRLAERFDAIVLPDQSAASLRDGHARGAMPEEYTGGLGADGARALDAFVAAGGTLVALDSASAYAIEMLKLDVKDALSGVDSKSFYCPGSILRASVETARPLAHGLPPELPVWFEGSPAFEAPSGQVLARYGDGDPLLSGWLLGGERLRGKAAIVEVPHGRGRVVLFGFRPQYRAQTRVGYVALLNALYLSAARP